MSRRYEVVAVTRLDEPTTERLDALDKQYDATRSWVLRRALKTWLLIEESRSSPAHDETHAAL